MPNSAYDEPLLSKVARLTNDDILSDVERVQVRALLHKAQTARLDLELEIRQLASQTNSTQSYTREWDLRLQLATLEHVSNDISQLQVALTPHKRLPPEILGEIFALCVGSDELRFPTDLSKPHWVIGRVCRRWRQILLSDSRVWKRISVDVPACRASSFKAIQVLLGLQVVAMITIQCYDQTPRTALEHLATFLDFMLPRDFTSIVSLHLSIMTSNPERKSSQRLSRTAFSMATRIRKLQIDLRNIEILDPVSRLGINFENLTDLFLPSGSPIPYSALLPILQRCHSLERLSAAFQKASWVGVPIGHQVLKLRSLRITVGDSNLFRYLHVPALAELHISGDVPFPNEDLSQMIIRSQCNLLIFDYDGGNNPMAYDCDALHKFFSMIPSLKSLSTFFLVLRQDTLHRIAYGEFLPQLETVQIRVDSPGAFVYLLETRLEGALLTEPIFGIIREARGYYVRLLHGHVIGMDTAREKLQRLNEEYGTTFGIYDD